MKTREILEWLSLAPADIPCWLAGGSLAWMWFTESLLLAILLAVAAVVFSLLACYWGMSPHKELGKVTNAAKLVAYPLFAVLVMIAVGVVFTIRPYPG